MTGTGPPTSAPVRSRAVDAVRGLVIVVMALDHVRDFLGNARFDATDLAQTWLISGPVIFWDTALPGSPPSYGLGLPGVYAVWIAVVLALYPACRWYAARAVRR